MPLGNYGLPLPPNRGTLPSGARPSKVKSLLARYQALNGKRSRVPTNKSPVLSAQVYKPPQQQQTWTNSPRDILTLISRFARQRKIIIIRYRKKNTGETVTRAVEPYALRLKRSQYGGKERYLYAYDIGHGNSTTGIHSFLLGNIQSVMGTNTTYSPRWKVEL